VRYGVRWAIAAVILMIAGVVAIWPRSESTPTPQETTQSTPDLTQARAKADLPPCATAKQGPADLRGIPAECLADGLSVDVAQAVGAPVLVNVWATWCSPCKTELPVLDQYAREPGAIKVVTLAVQSTPADALELLTALDVHLPALLDESGKAAKKLHPGGLPASYLVSSDGTVAFIENPRLFRSVDEIRQAVAHG
jgi:thiol-disulfide isomerase/thioredoxin